MGEEQNYTWAQEGSNFYKVDDLGNKIFTTEVPTDMTGVYVMERAINEPQPLYRVYNKNPKTQKGHITLLGRRDRNRAIKTLYNDAELKTEWFGDEVANYNRAEFRRYLKSDAGRRALGGANRTRTVNVNGETTTYKPKGHVYDNEEHANLANDILNPQRKQTDVDWGQVSSIDGKISWWGLEKCKTCGPNGKLLWVKKTRHYDLPVYGFEDTSTIHKTQVQKEVEDPTIETLYAVPHQGSEKTIVEQQQTPPVTTSTSSISLKTVSKPTKKSPTRKKSLKPTKPTKPSTTTTTTRTTSEKITPPQSSSKQYKIYYDPDGNELRREIINEKMGGLLKYISK